MKYKELLKQKVSELIVESYGYTEVSIFSSHFEPFAHKRTFKFEVTLDGPIHDRNWLFFEDENSEDFTIKDGIAYCDDPDLWSRP